MTRQALLPRRTAMQRCWSSSATRCLLTLCLLVMCVSTLPTANAIVVEAILPPTQMLSVEKWTTSVQAIKALQLAIEDDRVQLLTRAALEDAAAGFLHCGTHIYRCDGEDNVVEVVLDELVGGRVNWGKLPSTVKRIFVRHSVLKQPLIMSELPQQLEEFSATDTVWETEGLLTHPADGLREAGIPVVSCPRVAETGRCEFELQSLRCEKCGLSNVDLSASAALFPNLKGLNLNHNPALALSKLHDIPASITSLQLSNTTLRHLTLQQLLEAAPDGLQRLNVSYTGIPLQLEQLAHGKRNLTVLDLSGLAFSAVAGAAQPSQRICTDGGFSPVELYLTFSTVAQSLPDLKDCTRLAVVDMSCSGLTQFSFDRLPETLEVLHLNNNTLTGQLVLSSLPRNIRSLDVSSNHMHGSLHLADLPPAILYFDVSNNAFSGAVNLTALPESVEFVYLQHNSFTGEADLVDIPLGIRFIMIHHNSWDYRLPAP